MPLKKNMAIFFWQLKLGKKCISYFFDFALSHFFALSQKFKRLFHKQVLGFLLLPLFQIKSFIVHSDMAKQVFIFCNQNLPSPEKNIFNYCSVPFSRFPAHCHNIDLPYKIQCMMFLSKMPLPMCKIT